MLLKSFLVLFTLRHSDLITTRTYNLMVNYCPCLLCTCLDKYEVLKLDILKSGCQIIIRIFLFSCTAIIKLLKNYYWDWISYYKCMKVKSKRQRSDYVTELIKHRLI